MLSFSVPPGYRRKVPVRRPKLDGFTGIIDAWLEADRGVHRKQRHTAKRVFDRLREEHGFTGGYTIVKDYMRERERQGREMFVPLAHPPGHAQADFGEAVVILDGVERKAHFFAFDLPQSDAWLTSGPIRRRPPRPGSTGTFMPSPSSVGCRCRCSMTTTDAWWRGSCRTAAASGPVCLAGSCRTI
jgi:transposase